MGCAEVISLDEVRARTHWATLRQRLHERFDRWLDQLEAALPEVAPTLGQVSETIWALRQQLTGGVAETIVHHTHPEEQHRPYRPCPTCARVLPARGPVHRCVETLVGAVELERPYFYCPVCRTGTYPLDEALDVSAGRLQRDVQQAAVDLATEVPYETASTLFGRLSGITVSSERMHTVTHQVAAGLGVVEVAPSREEIDRRVAQVAAGRFRRPVLVLGIDGAYVPSRPESARGRRPGQARHRARRARWRHVQDREAFGHAIGERMHPLAAHADASQIAKQSLRLVIGHFRDQLGGRLLHVELGPPRCQAQDLIQRIYANAAGAAIEIRTLQLDWSHESLDGARHRSARCQAAVTLRTVTLRAGVFALMCMRNNGFGEATGERLTQVPERLGHLCEGRRGLLELRFQSIEPLVKAVMELVA